ncbi:MAG: hypothetical protein AAGA80_05310 [Cyanobacteria bacterium P01_F01_bin.143]
MKSHELTREDLEFLKRHEQRMIAENTPKYSELETQNKIDKAFLIGLISGTLFTLAIVGTSVILSNAKEAPQNMEEII